MLFSFFFFAIFAALFFFRHYASQFSFISSFLFAIYFFISYILSAMFISFKIDDAPAIFAITPILMAALLFSCFSLFSMPFFRFHFLFSSMID
jgi:hypothetical protein